MKIVKRLTSIILTLALCMSNISMSNIHMSFKVDAVSEKYGDYLYYRKVDENDDGKYDYIIISDCDKSADKVVIPNKIDGLNVSVIEASTFSGCSSQCNRNIKQCHNKRCSILQMLRFNKHSNTGQHN